MAADETDKAVDTVNEAKATTTDHVSAVDVPAAAGSKELKVSSVGLTDAVAKDQPNFRSKNQIQLYAFVVFSTLSEWTLNRI